MSDAIGSHLTDVRTRIEEVVILAVDETGDLQPLSEQIIGIDAQRKDWRELVNHGDLVPPWVVYRIGRGEPWSEGPGSLLCHTYPVEIYYVIGNRNYNDPSGSAFDETVFRPMLEQAAGSILSAFRAGGHEAFTVDPTTYSIDGGDSLDANSAFLQYKMAFEAVRVSFRIWVAFPA